MVTQHLGGGARMGPGVTGSCPMFPPACSGALCVHFSPVGLVPSLMPEPPASWLSSQHTAWWCLGSNRFRESQSLQPP